MFHLLSRSSFILFFLIAFASVSLGDPAKPTVSDERIKNELIQSFGNVQLASCDVFRDNQLDVERTTENPPEFGGSTLVYTLEKRKFYLPDFALEFDVVVSSEMNSPPTVSFVDFNTEIPLSQMLQSRFTAKGNYNPPQQKSFPYASTAPLNIQAFGAACIVQGNCSCLVQGNGRQTSLAQTILSDIKDYKFVAQAYIKQVFADNSDFVNNAQKVQLKDEMLKALKNDEVMANKVAEIVWQKYVNIDKQAFIQQLADKLSADQTFKDHVAAIVRETQKSH